MEDFYLKKEFAGDLLAKKKKKKGLFLESVIIFWRGKGRARVYHVDYLFFLLAGTRGRMEMDYLIGVNQKIPDW